MNWSAIAVIFAIGVQVIAFIWFFSRLNSKFESHLEDDADKHKELEKKYEHSEKRFYEAFERIGRLESSQSAQVEINRNRDETYKEIKEWLKSISKSVEELVRNRRSTDQ